MESTPSVSGVLVFRNFNKASLFLFKGPHPISLITYNCVTIYNQAIRVFIYSFIYKNKNNLIVSGPSIDLDSRKNITYLFFYHKVVGFKKESFVSFQVPNMFKIQKNATLSLLFIWKKYNNL